MILTDKEILEEMEKGNIIIEPFNRENLGSNSYDVTLGENLIEYCYDFIDIKKQETLTTNNYKIIDIGITITPNTPILGTTAEYTETHNLVPMITGRSSVARYGVAVEISAGFGDIGYCGHWTLEIVCHGRYFRLYKGMKIAQLYWARCGEVLVPYNKKPSAKYSNHSAMPIESRLEV